MSPKYLNEVKYYNTKEAAKMFRYSEDHLTRLAREGKVKATKRGREWLWEARHLENMFIPNDQEKTEELDVTEGI